jgi:hypothetical protein
MIYSRVTCLFPIFGALVLSSCIGLRAEISLRENGSGRMSLEYRVSRTAESLGRLDGNERWQTVPVGRADFDRSLERLPGLRLVSFSSKEEEAAVVNRAELEFTDIKALIPFLGGTDSGAVLTEAEGKNRLSLIIYPGAGDADSDLLSLVRELSRGYGLSLSLSAPGGAELSLTDGQGRPLDAAGGVEVRRSGKKASLSVDTGDLLSSSAGLGVEFIWPRTK